MDPRLRSSHAAESPLRPSQTSTSRRRRQLQLPRHIGCTASSTIRREEQDPRLKSLSAQPSMAWFVKPLDSRPPIIPCPPLDLVHRHERSPCRMPCKTLDSALATRIFTLPSLPIFSVGAAGTIKVTGNRLAAAIGALEECSAKRLMRSVIPRGTQFPIQASLGSVYIRPRDRGIPRPVMV